MKTEIRDAKSKGRTSSRATIGIVIVSWIATAVLMYFCLSGGIGIPMRILCGILGLVSGALAVTTTALVFTRASHHHD